MIHGRIIDARATVPVVFRLPGQPNLSLNFVVNSAFNGYLTLPVQALSAMNLPLHSSTPIKLADGLDFELSRLCLQAIGLEVDVRFLGES